MVSSMPMISPGSTLTDGRLFFLYFTADCRHTSTYLGAYHGGDASKSHVVLPPLSRIFDFSSFSLSRTPIDFSNDRHSSRILQRRRR